MKTAIEQTKLLIDKHCGRVKKNRKDNYNRLYMFTNENIDAYLKEVNVISNQRALSVLASGDHVFNLIAKGIKDIDTFDINKLTEYYVFGLKMAIITKCNYTEFMDTYHTLCDLYTSPDEVVAIISDLLPFMDEKYRKYWRTIVDYYFKKEKNSNHTPQHNLFYILRIENSILEYIPLFNIYLTSEESYNNFKSNLTKSNITFRHSNVTDLSRNFQNKYDYLLLSNILDYIDHYWGANWTIEKLNSYLDSLKPLLNPDAIIFLHYCFSEFRNINFTDITLTDFNKDKILTFRGAYNEIEHMILKRLK